MRPTQNAEQAHTSLAVARDGVRVDTWRHHDDPITVRTGKSVVLDGYG